MIGKGVRRIGFWTLETGNIRKELNNSPLTSDLEGIIWPGGSSTIPKRLLTQTSSKKLRIGVPVNSGFRELVNMVYDPVSNATIVSGFCIDVFKAAMSMLTYEVDYEFIPYLSGSYNDLVMQVYLQIQLGSKDYIGFHSVLPLATNNINFEDSRLKIYNSPKDYADALSKGSKNGGVSAIIDEIPYIKISLAQYPADHYTMVVPNNSSTTNGFGYAFSKGSPLVSNISRAIASLREEKKLKMMEDYWFSYFSSQPPTFMSQDPSSNPSRLSLKRFGGLFLITGISSTLVLFIFFICSVYRKRHALRGIFMEKLEDLKDYIHNLHTCLRIYCEKIQC
ncbi:hypothetical protein ACOSP7_006797 [Xanthoceras sorbifolium]